MSDPVFECRSASVTFALRDGPRPIIHDISLEVHNAEFLSIVGPSGTPDNGYAVSSGAGPGGVVRARRVPDRR